MFQGWCLKSPLTVFRAGWIQGFEKIESFANEISKALVPKAELEDTRLTLRYVLVELLRNVVQHSHAPVEEALWKPTSGMRRVAGRCCSSPWLMPGIGIPASLRTLHPNLSEPEAALEKSLWPHISGTFEEGLTGTQQNAGMGLFFIAEMAKLTGGTLLIATRGATLLSVRRSTRRETTVFASSSRVAPASPERSSCSSCPWGMWPTTPRSSRPSRSGRSSARLDVPSTGGSGSIPPRPRPRFEIRKQAENTPAAIQLAHNEITPRILRREPIVLDFSGLRILTQSYLHSLLFEPLRLAWALRTPIHVRNVEPAVRSNLELLENYALAG